ncbi:unnamed protein product [Allacma fusca]|uniref:Uncharacterized protein n=1 Tax=Allacma fusca TaxID=39272 RepID=A0A8J2KAZ0_9HEXA|nr:unnamed protein product [Allacma fusca]
MAVTYDFDPTPVLCVTVDSVIKETTSDCSSWSFCKQDCEAPASRCYQILINYRKFNRTYETIPEVVTEAEMQIGSRFGCYYSRRNPRLVVIDPKWVIPTSSLAVTLGLPATLLTTSIFIFCFLAAQYCPCASSSDRLKPEGVKTQQGRYSSIQDVNPKA